MIDFTWLKKYSFDKEEYMQIKFNNNTNDYCFKKVTQEEVELQEKRLGRRFPEEIKAFYLQVGAGKICIDNKDDSDEIMAPDDVVDFILGEGFYETSTVRGHVDLSAIMPIIKLSDNMYFYLEFSMIDEEGRCPILDSPNYNPIVIAGSLEKFIRKMDAKPDYYMDIWDREKERYQRINECIGEIKKYVPSVHELRPGTSMDKIREYECKYHVYLPTDYRLFLTNYNGAELFVPGTVIVGIYDERSGPKEKCVNYLEENEQKKWPGMGDNLLIVADLNYGDMVCLDRETSKIVNWSHEIGEIDQEWDSFSAWLKDEMEIGKSLVDYEGNDKE